MNDIISQQEVLSGIAPELRPFFLVATATLKRPNMPIIESLWQAVEYFAPTVRLVHPVHVLISTAPFQVPLENGTLTFTPNPSVINIAVENLVFLDVLKMLKYPKEIQVACIVEEFVHAFMHVRDEDLTSKIVAAIYPNVTLVEGKYAVAAQRAEG